MKRLLVVVVAAAIALTGCSIGLPGAPKHSKTSTTLGAASLPTTIPYTWAPLLNAVPADVTAAQTISAQQTDFPAGWNANSLYATTTPNDAVIDEAFVQCMFGPTPSPLSAYVVSPVYAGPDGSTIAQSFVRVVASTTAARTDFANFKPARASSCEAAMYNRQFTLPPTTKIVGKKFGYDPPDSIPSDTVLSPEGSTDIIGISFFVSPRDANQVYEDLFAYGVGRYEVVELFQDSDQTPAAAAEASALKVLRARAQAAPKN